MGAQTNIGLATMLLAFFLDCLPPISHGVPMKVNASITKMCRGQGTAYLLLNLKDGDLDRVKVRAYSEDGVSLPLEIYPMDNAQGDDALYVLATPLLDTNEVIIHIIDAAKESETLWRKSFSRSRIKWASRLLYKIDPELARQMRDIDKNTDSNQVHILPLYYTSAKSKGQVVVKGIISSPEATDEVELKLLKGDGSQDKGFSPFFQNGQVILSEGVRRFERPFTARIPDDGRTYCLVATASNVRSGFMCFDEPSRAYYAYEHIPQYFRLADFDRWKLFTEERERRVRLMEPSDCEVSGGPLFSIIVPLYHTPVSTFQEMVDSVKAQLYSKWELILINSTPGDRELSEAAMHLDDPRVNVITLEENLGIADNTNVGIDAAQGDYIAFFDHDDLLDKLALFRYAQAIASKPETDVLYCDEDFLTEAGDFINPHFKPEFNIDLLRCHNYVTHLLVVRAGLAKGIRLRSEFDGAQDYDLVLRLAELTDKFVHIPEVLYHWRMSDSSTAKDSGNKSYAAEAGLRALTEHYARMGLDVSVGHAPFSCFYSTTYHVKNNPLVSIIIPNKDSSEILSKCIESLFEKSEYRNFEVIVVENNSTSSETFAYYAEIQQKYEQVHVVRWPGEFNYSKINNFGVSFAKGDFLLLLNNDVEVITANWLSSMLGFCQRDDVGVVGARLLYPDDTIQHVGVGMIFCKNRGEMGGPIHVFGHLDSGDPGYMNRAAISQDVTIVTGACLMTKRSVFDSVGGLSEQYAVAYNDVDYCLKVRQAGKLIVFDAAAELYHYESFSRGSDEAEDKIGRFVSEQGRLRMDWPECFYRGDPSYTKFMLW